MKKQPTVPPVGEQAPSPPQLDSFSCLFEPPCILAGAALELFHQPSVFSDPNSETSSR
jgi:hypothetical protein